ncbi:MAG: TetR family transcriptional regulator C-terminal domain-containing protein [Rubrobacter sp.]
MAHDRHLRPRLGMLRPESLLTRLGHKDPVTRGFLEENLSGNEDSRDKLLAVCDAYREYFTAREMRGCAFVNCAAGFPDPDHPARRVIGRHKAGVQERIRDLAAEEDPATLAERLFIVLEGAYVTSALEGDGGGARPLPRVLRRPGGGGSPGSFVRPARDPAPGG